MSPAETRYATGEQELLGIIRAVREWRCYLDGAVDVTILIDHNPLIYLQTQPNLSRRQVRWMEELSRYKYEIKYIPGATNVADPISRNPALANEVALTSSSSPQNADSKDAMTVIMTLSSRAERPVYAITTRRTAARLRENAELGQVAAREAAQRANQLVPPEDLAAAHTPGQARMTSAQQKKAQPAPIQAGKSMMTLAPWKCLNVTNDMMDAAVNCSMEEQPPLYFRAVDQFYNRQELEEQVSMRAAKYGGGARV
ncbi:hypothetical protein QJQ45_008569 [Haematococcus lacustris]|nr:hypothetical protein QJQ45_008569 [Haematococcus lacustris]